MTLLIHSRLTAWAAENNIIPTSQNGFREGYRTNNNAFILRCAIEKARSLGRSLYVATIDISNVFPSTHHSALWVKLQARGAGGKIFDWLRMLYEHMEYVVRIGDKSSEPFKALIGILIGDPASPTLWNLFMSDFDLPVDIDDVYLDGVNGSDLEHADDVLLLMSYSTRGLQAKIDAVFYWCAICFLIVNAIKSECAVFETLPRQLPVFWFGHKEVVIKDRFTYVGITFQSTHKNIFAAHYTEKAGKGRVISNAILGVESMTGSLPPLQGKKLYMARVDPHLVGGCEVAIDVDPPQLLLLQDVQHTFLRRVLRINGRSMLAPLFTETSVAPLQYRRVQLAIRYLGYLISLPESHLARRALSDSCSLNDQGSPGWVMDLRYALSRLPRPVTLPPVSELDGDRLTEVTDIVSKSMNEWLNSEMESPKMYLLQASRPPRAAEGPASSPQDTVVSTLPPSGEHRTSQSTHTTAIHVSPADFLKALLANRRITAILARYTHDVLLIFSSFPLFDPTAAASLPLVRAAD